MRIYIRARYGNRHINQKKPEKAALCFRGTLEDAVGTA